MEKVCSERSFVTKPMRCSQRYRSPKTSVADIAKACGLGKGTIYLYFKSKDEIIHAIIEDRIACIREKSDPFSAILPSPSRTRSGASLTS